MNVEAAATRWAETWARAWPIRDSEAIVALYAEEAVYRSPAFRTPDLGLTGVRRYLAEQFAAERDIECWFARPIATGDRAAVEWWASWTERGQELTYAGVTLLASTTTAKSSSIAITTTMSNDANRRTRIGQPSENETPAVTGWTLTER